MGKSKILKALEKVPSGTKLYSTAFGNLEFESIIEAWGNTRIELIEDNRDRRTYLPDGRYRKEGEVTLYPSREMRDWDKFAWKKGDVLVNKDRDAHIVFEKFTDDTYTTFTGRHYYMNDGKNKDAARACCNVSTECYTLETEYVAQSYINDLEKRLGGKLNHNTLEIEKPKFKDAEKKVIEDIEPVPKSDIPKHKFEPFEKVLCRDYEDSVWEADFFGFKVKNETETSFIYRCVGNIYKCCIPYKGNEHLLGTNKNVEE